MYSSDVLYWYLVRSWQVWLLEAQVDVASEHQRVEHPGGEAEEVDETADVRRDDHQHRHDHLQTGACVYLIKDDA